MSLAIMTDTRALNRNPLLTEACMLLDSMLPFLSSRRGIKDQRALSYLG